jgi:hypothetical protein
MTISQKTYLLKIVDAATLESMPFTLLRKSKATDDPGRARFPFSIFFWLFALLSLGTLVFGARELIESFQSRSWPRVPCRIVRSKIESRNDGHYSPSIEFRYVVNGQMHRSHLLSLSGQVWSTDYNAVAAQVAKYPAGSTNNCIVNPKDPERAFLEPSVSYAALVLAPAFMFIWAIYERVALFYWWRDRKLRRHADKRALSEAFSVKRAGRFAFWVGIVSLAFSSAFIIGMVILPLRAAMAARSWQATPCVILESGINEEHHHQGNSFNSHVLYKYEFAGREFTSGKFDLNDSMSSSYSSIKFRLEPYQPGATNICYVNPRNPTDAVLRRDFRVDWFFGIFFIAYFVMSLFLIGSSFYTAREAAASASGLPKLPKGRMDSLRVSTRQHAFNRSVWALVGVLACATVATFLAIPTIRSLRDFAIDFLPILYLCAALVGAGWCAKQFFQFAPQLFAPAPIIEISPAVLTLGEPFTLRWKFRSSTRRVKSLQFGLAAREEAKYKTVVASIHGADEQEKTEKRITRATPLISITEQGFFSEGHGTFTFPADVMHSFQSPKAKLAWLIQTTEDLNRGATFTHEFEVIVVPRHAVTPIAATDAQTQLK